MVKQIFEDLSDKIFNALPEDLKGVKDDAKKNVKAAVEAALSKMNLVTREEFDAQAAVLERAREKLAALEAKVKELEG